jgi:hypothetical protein
MVRVRVIVMLVVVVRVVVLRRVTKDWKLPHGAPFCCVVIMRPTAIAAPKPLSMFTTVIPDAQLVNMPNRAVKPDSAVP